MEDGNGIWLTLGLDEEGFKRKLEEAKNDVLKFSSIASASGSTLESLLKTPTKQLGSMGSEIKAVGDNIEKAWGIVRTLEGQVRDETKKLKEAYDEVRKAAGAAFMSGDDEQYRRLQSYQNALKDIIGSYKGVGEEVSNCAKELENQDKTYKNVTDRMPMLNGQLRNVRGEMQAMVLAAREQGGETAVAAVKSSEAYQQLQQKAKQLGITINEVNKETQMLASNTTGLQGVVSGLQGIVGGFSAAQGAMAVFGAKSEDLQKIQTRVQGCIAAMMGLQQVMQTLQKNSAFMIALSKLRTAFVGLAGGATTATGAVKALWTALKANPAGLVLTAITALVTALGVFAAKARKTAEDVAQEMKEMAERIHNELSEIKVRANLVWDNEESKRNLEELSQEWAREFEFQVGDLKNQAEDIKGKLYDYYKELGYSDKKATESAINTYIKGNALVTKGLNQQLDEFVQAGDKENAARVEYQIAYLSGDKEFINEALVQWRQYWIDSLQLQKDAVSETHTMQDSARKAEIDAMKDGLEKRLAEIEYERKQELAALDNYVNDLKKKYGGINAEQQGLIDSKRANINTKYDNKRDKAEDDDREERARRAKTIRETAARLQREYDQAMEAYRKSVAKTNQQVQNDIRQITIDGMEDGLEKTLEQLKLNHDKEMAQIEEQENEKIEQWRQLKEKEWAAQNPKADAGKNPYRKKAMYDENGVFQRGSLSETDAADLANALAVFTTMRENENKKWKQSHKQAEQDFWAEMIEEYGTYEQRKQKIAEDFSKKREALYKHDENGNRVKDENGNDVFIDGAGSGNLEELKRQEDEALVALGNEIASRSDVFSKWLGGLSEKTVKQLRVMLEASKKALENLQKDPDADPKKLEEAEIKVKQLEAAIEQAGLTPEEEDFEEWKRYCDVITKAGEDLTEFGDAMEGVFGESVSAIGKVISATSDGIKNIKDLVVATSKGIAESSDAAAKAALAAQSSVAILAIIAAIYTAITKLRDAVDGWGEDWQWLSDYLHNMTDNLTIQSLLTAGLSTLWDNTAKKAREHDKALEDIDNEIDELSKGYDALGKQAQKTFGASNAEIRRQQIELKKAQIELLKTAIAEEEEQKDPDNDKIKGWQNQISTLEGEIDDLAEAAVDAIWGEDINSAINSFADALADAWSSNTDAAQASNDAIREMIRKRIKQELLDEIEKEGKLKAIREAISNAFSDGIITKEELAAIEALGEQTAQELEEKYGSVFRMLNEETSNDRSAQARGIATASQESVDEFNGRATTIQGDTFNISENSNIIRDNTNAILSSVLQIEVYTQHLVRMDNDIHNIKSTINDIQTQGVRIRS